MSRHAYATDRNHAEIRDQLRKLGVFVWDTHTLGNGFPDLLCVVRKEAVLLEVKDPKQIPSKRELTELERQFFQAYPGPVFVVTSVEQALSALGLVKQRKQEGACLPGQATSATKTKAM